ncbi:hypothetical protein ACFC34_38995 [Streptomyces sp. NPDC056053]|uniref:hypothetical protein n=1 Tax=Streptomyces sp. NPDC056053 TaxID=3345696 RepID=UPI0035E1A1E4
MTRQQWAVEQQPGSVVQVFSSRDRVGTCLGLGDVERGPVLVDRAAVAGRPVSLGAAGLNLAVGVLNLRGMESAGRLQDKAGGKREAQWHLDTGSYCFSTTRARAEQQAVGRALSSEEPPAPQFSMNRRRQYPQALNGVAGTR